MTRDDLECIRLMLDDDAVPHDDVRDLLEMARKSLDLADRLADADAVINTCLTMRPGLYCALQYRAKWCEK